MGYKEYIAEENNVVFNTYSFIYGSSISCGLDINLDILMLQEQDALELNQNFGDFIKTLNQEDSDYENQINNKRLELLESLISKGYDINNKVEPIIHEDN